MTDNEAVDAHPRSGAVRVVLGSLVAASRHLGEVAGGATPAETRGSDLRYVALGALCVAQDRVAALTRTGAGVARTVARPVAAVASPLVPAPLKRDVAAAVRRLDEYGQSVAATGSTEAGEIVTAVASDVAQEETLIRVIELIVAQVIDEILPAVLARLAEEPEQVRALVQGQSRGMVEELTNAARGRAAGGDEAVDKLLARVLRRRAARAARDPAPAPVPTPLPAQP